ncbi:hypothetical protein [Bradyrhizobium sp.]|uniref:hypothetical protein n=1 Tax=Bradyrhizobium sp. TaxID=376 RepID=UPI003C6EC003
MQALYDHMASQPGAAAPKLPTQITIRPAGSPDLSKLSDDDLKALYDLHTAASPPTAPVDATPNPEDVEADEYGSPYRDAQAPQSAGRAPTGPDSTGTDILKSLGTGLVKFGTGTLGAAGDIGNMASHGIDAAGAKLGLAPDNVQHLKDFLKSAASVNPFGINPAPIFSGPSSQDLQSKLESLTGPLHKPQGVPGEYAQTIGEFLPAALDPEMLAGKIPGLLEGGGKLLKRVIAPAVGSETAGQLAKGTWAEPYARVGGAFLGGVGASAFDRPVPGAAPVTPPALPAARTAKDDIADAAARLNIDFPRIAASDNLVTQRAGSALKEIPIIGDPIVKASRTANEQMGRALEGVEQGYGSGSALHAGEVAHDAITNWIGPRSQRIAERAYDNLDRVVKPNVTTGLEATRGMIADIAAERQAAGLGLSAAIDHVLEAAQRAGGLTTSGLKTLRTSVGEMLDNHILPANIRKSELKRIYRALSDDLDNSVYNSGLRERNGRFQKRTLAPEAFEKANTLASKINDRRAELAKIVGNDASAAPERVLDRLVGFASTNSRADANKLLLARKAIGATDWNEVASAVVSRMGRDVDGRFSPERFLTAYGKLSDRGKNLLFRSTGRGDLADALEDVATLSRKAKELNAYGNPSGTGRVVGSLSTVAAVATHPHLAVPAAVAGRLLARSLAAPIRPNANTLRTAQKNVHVAALLNHLLSQATAPATLIAGQQAAGQLSSPVSGPDTRVPR